VNEQGQSIRMQKMRVNEYKTKVVIGSEGGSGAIALRILGDTQLTDLPWQDIEAATNDFEGNAELVYGSYIYPIAPTDQPARLEVRVQYLNPADRLSLHWIGIENLRTGKKYVAEVNQSLLETTIFPLVEKEY
jgi:hypothetical protein